ncbi:MAG TPA: VWA domain-containing protein, partial [Gemmataceae bacterium]|nr:VWA domain-containing protein [Gemmataceae bacterium]
RTSGPPFLPDIQFSLPGMPAVGRLAVQASPKAHARYAEGSRAVVLVLDCSGSMMGKLPGGQTRFDEATRALLVVLAGIPKDTQVSVWAFSHRFDIDTGRSMQNHDAEQTIQRVHLARNWDPTPANLALVKRRIAMLVPYNETPIVRSLMEARKDFTDQHSFKTLVVLTDGMDNRFEAQPGGRWNGDPVYNPGGKLTIPAFLAQAFARDNIAVRVVGFQLPAREQAEAIRQFRTPLENLPNKGKFYLVDDPKRLIEHLRESLTQRLSFTLEEMDGWPVKGLKGGVSISRVGQDSHWITLSPGYYWVVIDATKRLRQKIEVRRGDRLLLTLDEKDDGFVLQRGLVQNDFRDKPLREARSGAWLLKVLQNQHSLQEDALQLMVTAEAVRDREVGGVRTLGRVTPSLILFQVRPQGDSKSRPVSLRYRSLTDWTAPAWGLVIKPWDRRAQPIPEAFWSEDPPTIVGTLRRGSHFSGDLQVLPKGGAVEVQLHKGERGPVQLLSLTIEKHLVETHDGKRQEVSCLVVRLTFPPGKPVMAQLPDFSGGQEHRFDSEAGRYTGSFWEMTPQQGQQEVKTLHLISLTGFREAALSSGQYARIELAVPDNHPRPQPP